VTRARRLEPAARVADRAEQEAARRFSESREEAARQRERLADMQHYRAEYLQRMQQAATGGMAARRIKDTLGFLERLDETIRQLEGMVAGAERAAEQRRREWLARRARSQALDEVVARYRREEARDSLRREERESDERNLRRGR
jgi:flagellar FliJ protein